MARTKSPVKYVVVDAFTDTEFKGNPAAICLLDDDREDEWMQSLASEFNVSQTCFLTRSDHSPDSPTTLFHLRWFTPVAEVKLCGHGTLATAHFCFSSGLVDGNVIEFSTLSGILTARKVLEREATESPNCENAQTGQPVLIELDFPVVLTADCNSNEASSVSKPLNGVSVVDMKKTSFDDLFVVLPSAKDVKDLQPQFDEIQKCPGRGLIITALAPPESGFDFFSRFFCPKFSIKEDPVCGSAHCALALYWCQKLGKRDLLAYAASPRSGIVKLHLDEQNNRVKLQGKAVTVMEGSVLV